MKDLNPPAKRLRGEEDLAGAPRKAVCEPFEWRPLTFNSREILVSNQGEVRRLPFAFQTPTGGSAIKKAVNLKPSALSSGYLRVGVADRFVMVHRLVYMAFHGPIGPGLDVDHINGIRNDNRPENLRVATRQENAMNRQGANRNSQSGVRGVYFHKSSARWVFSVKGKQLASSEFKSEMESTSRRFHGG